MKFDLSERDRGGECARRDEKKGHVAAACSGCIDAKGGKCAREENTMARQALLQSEAREGVHALKAS
jgi:hypothetical protein